MTELTPLSRKTAERQKEKSWSIYSTCDDIPLRLFIEVYTGNKKALVKRGNPPQKIIDKTAEKIIFGYAGIVGSRSIKFEIESRSKLMNYDSKIKCLEIVKRLIRSNEYNSSTEILEALNFKKNLIVSKENDEIVLNLIESELAATMLNLDILKKRFENENKEDKKPTKQSFYKEIALVSQHFKMPIDIERCTASIYGNYVRNMIDEIKIMKSWQMKR